MRSLIQCNDHWQQQSQASHLPCLHTPSHQPHTRRRVWSLHQVSNGEIHCKTNVFTVCIIHHCCVGVIDLWCSNLVICFMQKTQFHLSNAQFSAWLSHFCYETLSASCVGWWLSSLSAIWKYCFGLAWSVFGRPQKTFSLSCCLFLWLSKNAYL